VSPEAPILLLIRFAAAMALHSVHYNLCRIDASL